MRLCNKRKLLQHGSWLLALLALPLAAAGVSGAWTGKTTPEQGNEETLYLKLQVAGSQVTGTVGPRASEQYAISEGKLEGNRITFQMTGLPKGVFHFDLTLDGDTLRGEGWVTGPEGERHVKIELTRAP